MKAMVVERLHGFRVCGRYDAVYQNEEMMKLGV